MRRYFEQFCMRVVVSLKYFIFVKKIILMIS